MDRSTPQSGFAKAWRLLVATVGAFAMMLGCFLLLPVLQAISATAPKDLELRSVDTAALPPPPPPPVDEDKQQEKPPEDAKPPEMQEAAQPLSLDQLEIALNPGMGGGDVAGDYTIKIQGLAAAGGGGKDGDDLFSLADLDQKPRVLFQQQPALNAQLRKKMPATVNVVFVVDESGRVDDPKVQTSSDPAFEAVALAAIKQWKFEPGKRAGKPVRFRMRQPMTFK